MASSELQQYLVDTISQFVSLTNSSGMAIDDLFFSKPGVSVYSQWRGWKGVVEQLRARFATRDFLVDNRYCSPF